MEDLRPISIGPSDDIVKVADFNLGEGHDTIWLRIKQESPIGGWDFSYALCWWQSSVGRELGTIKIYSHPESEIFTLGLDRVPTSLNGSIYVKPRAYNLAWIRATSPPVWTLRFEALSGKKATAPTPEPVPSGGISGSFVDSVDGRSIPLIQLDFTKS